MIFRILVILFLLIATFSCNQDENKTDFDSDLFMLNLDRIKLCDKKLEYIQYRHNNFRYRWHKDFSEHYRKIEGFIDKIQYSIITKKDTLFDFSEEFDFFHAQKHYEVDFFEKEYLSVAKALFIADNLLYNMKLSELGNGYFVYSINHFDFEEFSNGDSLSYSIQPIQMLRDVCYLGPTSGEGNNEVYSENSFNANHRKFNISNYKSGDTIEGAVLLEKTNYPVFVPFKYVKK